MGLISMPLLSIIVFWKGCHKSFFFISNELPQFFMVKYDSYDLYSTKLGSDRYALIKNQFSRYWKGCHKSFFSFQMSCHKVILQLAEKIGEAHSKRRVSLLQQVSTEKG
jgi:hypothetical protein